MNYAVSWTPTQTDERIHSTACNFNEPANAHNKCTFSLPNIPRNVQQTNFGYKEHKNGVLTLT